VKVIAEYGDEELAKVYVARMREEEKEEEGSRRRLVEFVESVQPPIPRERKWVLIVSSMFGCPINCKMCDAGGNYGGVLTKEEIASQIDFLVKRRFPEGDVPIPNFKIQFARMGEPSLNPAVLDAMESLPETYDAPGLHVSLSTIAPDSRRARDFFERLIDVKNRHYPNGKFQLQFSIHTTDAAKRDELIPTRKWSFDDIASYARRFSSPDDGDKKVTLNFAPAAGYPIDAGVIRSHFDPDIFVIKLTPLNPTVSSHEASLRSAIDPHEEESSAQFVDRFEREGYQVILSIGELEENRIGSNCGQFIQRALASGGRPDRSYALDEYRRN